MTDEAKPGADKASDKWASEVFGFLRIFDRVGTQVPGLLLMLIGWAAFLSLVVNLSSGNAAPAIDVPQWSGGQIRMIPVPLSTIVTIGSLGIVAIWSARSGAYLWLWGPLTYVLRIIGIVITHVTVWGVVVLSELLTHLSRRLLIRSLFEIDIDAVTTGNKLKIINRNQLDNKKAPEALREALMSQEVKVKDQASKNQASEGIEVDLGIGEAFEVQESGVTWFVNTKDGPFWLQSKEKGKEQVLQISEPRWRKRSFANVQNGLEAKVDVLQDKVFAIYWWLLTRLAGRGRIGLSPLYSYSYAEDALAAKAPMQAYARAISRLYYVLRDSDVERHMLLEPLPMMLRVKSRRQARLARKWLGVDLLLWGSYVSAEPPVMLLNFDYQFRKVIQAEREDTKSSVSEDFSTALDPFGELSYLADGAVIVDQRNLVEVYIAMFMSLALALRARVERPQWLPLPAEIDSRMSVAQRRLLDATLARLSADVATILRPQLTNPPETTSPAPHTKTHESAPTGNLELTAKEAFVHFAGDWIGTQLGKEYWRYGFDRRKLPIRAYLDVMDVCVQLAPTFAQNHYRQAVLQLLLAGQIKAGKESTKGANAEEMTDLAWNALKRGQQIDGYWYFRKIDRSLLCIKALDVFREERGALRVAAVGYSEEDTAMVAKAIVYIARAVSGAEPDAKETMKDIQSDFKGTIFYKLVSIWDEERRQHPVSRILFRLLELDFPVSSTGEKVQ